jgi:hypothetical protein
MKKQNSFDWALFSIFLALGGVIITIALLTEWQKGLGLLLAFMSILTGIFVLVSKRVAISSRFGYGVYLMLLGIVEFFVTYFASSNQPNFLFLFMSLLASQTSAVIIYKSLTLKQSSISN